MSKIVKKSDAHVCQEDLYPTTRNPSRWGDIVKCECGRYFECRLTLLGSFYKWYAISARKARKLGASE